MKIFYFGCITVLLLLNSCGPKVVNFLMVGDTPYPDSSFDFSMSTFIQMDTISYGTSRIFDRVLPYRGSHGDSLFLKVWYPGGQHPDSSKLLLLIPGFRGQPLELYSLAIAATKHGLITAILCPRGVDVNENTPFDYGLFQLQDAEDGIQAYQKTHHLSILKVGVFGCSLGSVVAMNLAAKDDRVHGAVLESVMPDLLNTSKKLLSGAEEDSLQKYAATNGIPIADFNPKTIVQNFPPNKPLFIIWGEKDKLVSSDERDQLRSLVEKKIPTVRFEVVPGAGHNIRYGFPLSQEDALKLNNEIIAFLLSIN